MSYTTKGEWKYTMCRKRRGENDIDEYYIESEDDDNTIAIVYGRGSIVNEANARFIAAAPDLLEALGHYIDDGECSFDHHGCCQTHGGDPCREQNAKAAIAKAKE